MIKTIVISFLCVAINLYAHNQSEITIPLEKSEYMISANHINNKGTILVTGKLKQGKLIKDYMFENYTVRFFDSQLHEKWKKEIPAHDAHQITKEVAIICSVFSDYAYYLYNDVYDRKIILAQFNLQTGDYNEISFDAEDLYRSFSPIDYRVLVRAAFLTDDKFYFYVKNYDGSSELVHFQHKSPDKLRKTKLGLENVKSFSAIKPNKKQQNLSCWEFLYTNNQSIFFYCKQSKLIYNFAELDFNGNAKNNYFLNIDFKGDLYPRHADYESTFLYNRPSYTDGTFSRYDNKDVLLYSDNIVYHPQTGKILISGLFNANKTILNNTQEPEGYYALVLNNQSPERVLMAKSEIFKKEFTPRSGYTRVYLAHDGKVIFHLHDVHGNIVLKEFEGKLDKPEVKTIITHGPADAFAKANIYTNAENIKAAIKTNNNSTDIPQGKNTFNAVFPTTFLLSKEKGCLLIQFETEKITLKNF
jgi:hypothetical protein